MSDFSIILEVTKRCNLACTYCYKEEMPGPKEIDFSEAVQRIDIGLRRADELNISNIHVEFTGGEPLLKFNLIKQIIDYFSMENFRNYSFVYSMVTNGTLFYDEVKKYCEDYKFALSLSLDGPEQIYNKNRILKSGSGAFSDIKIDNFIDYDGMVTANMVISEDNYMEFYNSFKYIIERGFTRIKSVSDMHKIWTEDEIKVLEKNFRECAELYFVCNKYGQKISWSFIDDKILSIMQPMKHYFCGAGVIAWFFDVTGNIRNCNACESLEVSKLGHIQDGVDEELIKPYGHFKRQLGAECEECEIKKYCMACDCVFLNKQITGRYDTVPQPFCRFSKISYDISKHVISKMNREMHQGQPYKELLAKLP